MTIMPGLSVGTYAVTIHAPSSVHHTVMLGAGSIVWPFATILEGTQIGEGCVIGACCFVGRRARIGDGTRIHHGAALPDHARVGSRVYIGSNVTLANVRYPILADKAQEIMDPPLIEDDAVIGANAVILPGVHVGAGAIIGAGAVVTHNVPAGWTVVGNPARRLMPRIEGWNEAVESIEI